MQEAKLHQLLCEHDAEINQLRTELSPAVRSLQKNGRTGRYTTNGEDCNPELVARLETDLEKLEEERDGLRKKNNTFFIMNYKYVFQYYKFAFCKCGSGTDYLWAKC